MPVVLEYELYGELDHAIVAGADAVVAADVVGDLAEVPDVHSQECSRAVSCWTSTGSDGSED